MRRQTRPFIVEIKQKRGRQRRVGPIWGDFDFSAAIAETTNELEETELPNCQIIDSNVISADRERVFKLHAEPFMPDVKDAEPIEATSEPAVKAGSPKRRAPQSRKTKAQPMSSARTTGATPASSAAESSAAVRSGRKIYSEEERAQKLSEIEKSMNGGATLKMAVSQAGIAEQTYYHWRKAATPVSGSDDLKDLVALEDENKRLKSLLAERLRKENAELKKKLGLA
ncbi:transposase [Mesorhizobium sp. f-mel]